MGAGNKALLISKLSHSKQWMLVVTCGYTDGQGRRLLKHVSDYGHSLLATLYTGIKGTSITL